MYIIVYKTGEHTIYTWYTCNVGLAVQSLEQVTIVLLVT